MYIRHAEHMIFITMTNPRAHTSYGWHFFSKSYLAVRRQLPIHGTRVGKTRHFLHHHHHHHHRHYGLKSTYKYENSRLNKVNNSYKILWIKMFLKFLKTCLCLSSADSFWQSVPGSGASVRERTFANLRSQSRS